jgi:lipopolysaccharide/colanic/teichoic acid biosynthesis glycosyltransferase
MSEMHPSESESSIITARSFPIGPLSARAAGAGYHHSAASRGPQHLFRYRFIKRSFDIILILLASPVLLLLVSLIAIVIRIGSQGPIFFSHRRIRSHGAFFTMWKFRTMCVNSDEVLNEYLAAHPSARAEWRRTHKLRHDPRVTPVGRFLRRTSLDELPQLWNVFTGSMSLGRSLPPRWKSMGSFSRIIAWSSRGSPGSGRSPAAAPAPMPSASNWTVTMLMRGP